MGRLREKFQFTPLREGRHDRNVPAERLNEFQFTPLREGRRLYYTHAKNQVHFNSRPSARGDVVGCEQFIHFRPHFNSRPSARGDGYMVKKGEHAALFQFTPLREGRLYKLGRKSNEHFNSRPSARGDRITLRLCRVQYISIHAPPRGATIKAFSLSDVDIFQFTPLREGRLELQIFKGACPKFQFTPLREGRLSPPFIYS